MNARVSTFYYPVWKARVNGQRIEISIDERGVILVPISADKFYLELIFDEPLLNKASSISSLLVWLLILVGILYKTRRLQLPLKSF